MSQVQYDPGFDIEQMRVKVALAFGVPESEVRAIYDVDYCYRFSYCVGALEFIWQPGQLTMGEFEDGWMLSIQKPEAGKICIFEGEEWSDFLLKMPLDWPLINRFLYCMGYEIPELQSHVHMTYHERLGWYSKMKENGLWEQIHT